MISPLDGWIGQKLGLAAPLSREALAGWQFEQARRVMALAKARAPFYQQLYRNTRVPNSLEEFSALPFTTEEDLRKDGHRMLCVSQSEIERVITLCSSGTTQTPKRIFFTQDDQELTIDFFHRGMATLAKEGETAAIFLPCASPGNAGDLLCQGLGRLGVQTVRHGLIQNLGKAAEHLSEQGAQVLIGVPTQILALAAYCKAHGIGTNIERILLSTDCIPDSLKKQIEALWGCEVFVHFGMTEAGLGGAIDCRAHAGMHPRENDLLFEIVEPTTGRILAEGEWGELVMTTLTRRGMPLLRYRTGDRARFLPGPCPCGSILKRLDRIPGRLSQEMGGIPALSRLDEALFSFQGLVDYDAMLYPKPVLTLKLLCLEGYERPSQQAVRRAAEESCVPFEELRVEWETISQELPPYRGKRVLKRNIS